VKTGRTKEGCVKIDVRTWRKPPERELKELYIKNPFPLYRGTPIGKEAMKAFLLSLAVENATKNPKAAFVAWNNDQPVASAQVYRIPFLSDYWKRSIGGLGHIVVKEPVSDETFRAADALLSECERAARMEGIEFLSTSVPGPSISLIRALEKNGFFYAEGFVNMVGSTHSFRESFAVPGLEIREPVEKDFEEIADAYEKVPFPSRFVTDGGFDPGKALELYVRRFREVHEEGLGKLFIAELEGAFAGALLALVDARIEKATGIKTNPLSGMGIIIHPRAARRGVALALIETRQDYYKNEGVEYVNFGANFNNRPMILGLTKLGLQYGSIDMTFHKWLS